jgi:hypothetical protein
VELEIHVMVEGSGAEEFSERKLTKEILCNEVLFTPICKMDLIS